MMSWQKPVQGCGASLLSGTKSTATVLSNVLEPPTCLHWQNSVYSHAAGSTTVPVQDSKKQHHGSKPCRALLHLLLHCISCCNFHFSKASLSSFFNIASCRLDVTGQPYWLCLADTSRKCSGCLVISNHDSLHAGRGCAQVDRASRTAITVGAFRGRPAMDKWSLDFPST